MKGQRYVIENSALSAGAFLRRTCAAVLFLYAIAVMSASASTWVGGDGLTYFDEGLTVIAEGYEAETMSWYHEGLTQAIQVEGDSTWYDYSNGLPYEGYLGDTLFSAGVAVSQPTGSDTAESIAAQMAVTMTDVLAIIPIFLVVYAMYYVVSIIIKRLQST